jgi:hypothetical protein
MDDDGRGCGEIDQFWLWHAPNGSRAAPGLYREFFRIAVAD